ncbi:class I SAM-dependent methyltransferase [Halopenitus sp. H-Gu1]|uniref:class I SAM-dependent methyltransferase n=1 Tax=Halopenitus sp. H-Gu1 TaxID=3242697 RepID=UPI00359F10A3
MKSESEITDFFDTTGYISPRRKTTHNILPPLGFERKSPYKPAHPGKFGGLGAYRHIRLEQSKEVFSSLLEIIADKGPETVVEIGTFRGGSLYMWSRALKAPKKIISVDIAYNKMDRLFKNFSDEKTLHLVEGDSQNQSTEQRISDMLGDDQIDFLFLDGDHSYEGIKNDFEIYEPYVSDTGLIAIDDIANENCGVPKFWREISSRYDTKVIEDGSSSIGVVYAANNS